MQINIRFIQLLLSHMDIHPYLIILSASGRL